MSSKSLLFLESAAFSENYLVKGLARLDPSLTKWVNSHDRMAGNFTKYLSFDFSSTYVHGENLEHFFSSSRSSSFNWRISISTECNIQKSLEHFSHFDTGGVRETGFVNELYIFIHYIHLHLCLDCCVLHINPNHPWIEANRRFQAQHLIKCPSSYCNLEARLLIKRFVALQCHYILVCAIIHIFVVASAIATTHITI